MRVLGARLVLGLKIIAVVAVVIVVSCLVPFIAVAVGWVWALAVLVGKRRVGPRESWHDEVARCDFKARRVELKVAGSVLAVYLSALVIASMIIWDDSFDGHVWFIMGSLGVFMAGLMGPGMYLGVMGHEDWRRVDRRLQQRIDAPVLF